MSPSFVAPKFSQASETGSWYGLTPEGLGSQWETTCTVEGEGSHGSCLGYESGADRE